MNWLFIRLGIATQMTTGFPSRRCLLVVAVTMIWKGYPFVSIMTLAGLQSIPEDFYNAAKVDGANAFQRFRTSPFRCSCQCSA